MYQPILPRKFKLRRFRMEVVRKKRAILMSMVWENFWKLQISKNNHISKILFLRFSFKCISPIVAAAAAAAAIMISIMIIIMTIIMILIIILIKRRTKIQ